MGSRINRISLRFKLVIGFFIISWLILFLYAMYGFLLYRNLLQGEREKIALFNRSVSMTVGKNLRQIVNGLNVVSKEKSVQDLDPRQITVILESALNHIGLASGVMICNRDGEIIGSAGSIPGYLQNGISGNLFFSRAVKDDGAIVSESFHNKSMIISVSRRIENSSGRVTGIVVFLIDMNETGWHLFENVVDPGSYQWEVLLTTKTGILLDHSHLNLEGLSLDELDYSSHPVISNVLSGNWKLSIVDVDNRSWLTASEYIPLSDWLVIVQVPTSTLYEKVSKSLGPVIIITTLIMVFLLLVIWFWSRLFVRPLVRLTESLRDFGEKGIAAAIDTDATDELGKAIASFNKMVHDRGRLEREIFELMERERKRMGKHLQETLIDALTDAYHQGIIAHEELFRVLRDEDIYVMAYVEQLTRLLNTSINKVKSFSNLSPVSLVAGGLVKAVRELVEELVEQIGFTYHLVFDEKISFNDEVTILNCYYLIQEAVYSAVRIRSSSIVDITIKKNETGA
jgi:signal transduction histidine kinase